MLAPTPVTTPAPRERVTLWQGELRSREGAQGIPEYLAQVEPALLDTLALGQVLEMSLPGRERPCRHASPAPITAPACRSGAAAWWTATRRKA